MHWTLLPARPVTCGRVRGILKPGLSLLYSTSYALGQDALPVLRAFPVNFEKIIAEHHKDYMALRYWAHDEALRCRKRADCVVWYHEGIQKCIRKLECLSVAVSVSCS